VAFRIRNWFRLMWTAGGVIRAKAAPTAWWKMKLKSLKSLGEQTDVAGGAVLEDGQATPHAYDVKWSGGETERGVAATGRSLVCVAHCSHSAFPSASSALPACNNCRSLCSRAICSYPPPSQDPMCHTPLCIVGTYPQQADRWWTWFAFAVCDDKHSQAQRRVGVRLSDPAGRCVGRHSEGPCRAGLLLHRTRRESRVVDRLRDGPD
jgi:hypothetical protein